MVRWRYCLFLAMLLVLPVKAGSKNWDDDDEETRGDENGDEDEEDDDDDDDDQSTDKQERVNLGRRAPLVSASSVTSPVTVTRTVPRRPLECYVCAYKTETQMRSCLDPIKYRVHTMICHSAEDKCFTSVITKGSSYEAVMRGCRSGCIGTTETTCCDVNRCNNQALAVPVAPPHVLKANKANKSIPPSVLFFVTILLLLQTVSKVAFV